MSAVGTFVDIRRGVSNALSRIVYRRRGKGDTVLLI